ncbi:unnamed protein product [Brassica oleracea var. botrytis]
MGISLACDVTDKSSFNNNIAIGGSRSNDKEHNSGRSHYYMELFFFSTCRKNSNVEMAERVAVEQRVFMKETQVKKEVRAVRWR